MSFYCAIWGCDNLPERNGVCASHNIAARKSEREALKPKKKPNHIQKYFKAIKRFSDKKKKDNQVYSKRRKHYLEKYPDCQIKLDVCTGKATQIHHTAGRIGSNLTNKNTFKSTCDACHRKLHDVLSAKERREKGLLKD